MEQYTKVIFDASTQTESIIPMTEEEIRDLENGRKEAEEYYKMQISLIEEKTKIKSSVKDKLISLGFTEEETDEIINKNY